MSQTLRLALAVGVAIAAGASLASAAVLTHEDFNYGAGGLSGGNNYNPGEWTNGWGSSDPQPFSVGSGSLSDPTGLLQTSGGYAYSTIWANDPTKAASNERGLAAGTIAALNGDQTGLAPDAWVSFLCRRDSLTTANHTGGLSFGNGMQYQPGFNIGANIGATGEGTWQVFQGSSPWVDSGVPVVVGETALIVVKMDFQSNNDVIGTMWVNPTSSSAFDTPGATATFQKPFASNGGFAISGREYSFDEIRFGNAATDVTPGLPVPEPTSLAVIGLGLSALATRRHRRA